MKANEAPDKIWMSKENHSVWLMNPNSTRYIEYTRTDAFIEKAATWIETHVGCNKDFIEKFKKTMSV